MAPAESSACQIVNWRDFFGRGFCPLLQMRGIWFGGDNVWVGGILFKITDMYFSF